ncbi:hypothetical protein H6G97_27080 [Nostoc flagelliforme FACHB-838]|uniref:Uncharacterized protein n=1 Tax=Nostoc flagelliforme FACHB-838 TaxID=2692904 RepID=A0ABR8DVW0_9NOSO|nr:hypothetical protein [Nostoc flagelliforme]MBD2533037.1 hypothetical protein [Nostoc flagelliforme FACHB-838]
MVVVGRLPHKSQNISEPRSHLSENSFELMGLNFETGKPKPSLAKTYGMLVRRSVYHPEHPKPGFSPH